MSEKQRLTDETVRKILKSIERFWNEDDFNTYELTEELYEILISFGDELHILE